MSEIINKKELDEEMAELLRKLLGKKNVAVLTGGAYGQFQKQFLPFLRGTEAELKKLSIFPVCATSFYEWRNKNWKKVYEEKLSIAEKKKIKRAFSDALPKISY